MPYSATTATRKLLKLKKRIRAVAGGTSASKTISILLILIDEALSDTVPKTVHIVSESLPHLKLAAMADFLKIMKAHGYYEEDRWNRSDYVYTFENVRLEKGQYVGTGLPGTTFQFFGADSPQKVHGPRRDRLFVNEANNVPLTSFEQMEVRTNDTIWLDWNPTVEFWFYTDILPVMTDKVDFLTLTYLDNEALPQSIVDSIEARKVNKRWWRVYGQGLLGDVEGKVYTDWKIIDSIPHEARLVRRGLDFGYSQDPAAIVDVWYCNGGYILDERLYRTGMLNSQLADTLLNLEEPGVLCMADSAEPKSIDEIRLRGLNLMPVKKGQGSLNAGIEKVRDQRISVTSSSVNLIKEYRTYMYDTDKDGKITKDPTEFNNHLMDAVRYAFEGLVDRLGSEVATYGKGDSVTGYGRSASPILGTASRGYQPKKTVRTFR